MINLKYYETFVTINSYDSYRINFENEKPDQINDWELISAIKENDELLYDSSIRKNYRLIWKNLSFIKNKNKT